MNKKDFFKELSEKTRDNEKKCNLIWYIENTKKDTIII